MYPSNYSDEKQNSRKMLAHEILNLTFACFNSCDGEWTVRRSDGLEGKN